MTLLWLALLVGQVDIVVADNYPAHAKIVLSVTGAAKDASVLWEFTPEDGIETEELSANRIAVWAKPNSYSVRVDVIDWNGKKASKIRRKFTVGPAPNPPPGPGPGPGPTPPPIDERLGFSSLARDELRKVPAEWRSKSKDVANNFEAVAGQLAAGGFQSIEEANGELTIKNRAVIGGEGSAGRAAWLPWFQAWQVKADAMLPSKENYIQAYKETAAGLRLGGRP